MPNTKPAPTAKRIGPSRTISGSYGVLDAVYRGDDAKASEKQTTKRGQNGRTQLGGRCS